MNDKSKLIVIFDFDGTIANTIGALANIYNILAKRFHLNVLTENELSVLKNSSPKEIINRVGISGFKIFKIPFLIKAGRAEIKKEIKMFKPIPGMHQALAQLKSLGYKLGIVTSNSKENVNEFLKINDLEYFDFVYSAGIFSKDKQIKKFIESNRLTPGDVIYVGDEIRDIEAAFKNGIKVIAVSWGFNSKKSLEKLLPDYVVDKPSQLIEVIRKQPPF